MGLRQQAAWAYPEFAIETVSYFRENLEGGGLLAGSRQGHHEVRVRRFVKVLPRAQVAQMGQDISVGSGKVSGRRVAKHRVRTPAGQGRGGRILTQQVDVG